MNTVARRLRIIQTEGVLLVLASIGVSRLGHHQWQGTFTPAHWFVIAAAIWSSISGFTLQRKILNRSPQSRKLSTTSTPFTRWRAGNLVRLWTATTVGLCGLCLSEFAGPSWLVIVLFAVGLLLLLLWAPGKSPAQAP